MNIIYDGQRVEFLDWETGDYAPAVQDLGTSVALFLLVIHSYIYHKLCIGLFGTIKTLRPILINLWIIFTQSLQMFDKGIVQA